MVFVLYDQLSGIPRQTMLNVFYFYHLSWWIILGTSVGTMLFAGFALHKFAGRRERVPFTIVVVLILIMVGISQAMGSSIPKLSGEMSISAFFIIGLVINRFFLTYAVEESKIPSHQVQSDALTSLGILVSIVALWWPAALGFGEFLWKDYFQKETVMAQFQMTRYGAYVGWIILGFSIIGWKIIEKLIEARNRA